MAYRNYSYYLGLRKLAGLRSVAPAVAYFDTDFGQTAYAINKNEVFHLWGCEMTALRADCVRIRYKSSSTGSWVVIKDYLNQTSLSVAGSSSGPDYVQGFPQASGNFVGSDGSGSSVSYISGGTNYGNEEKPYGPIGQPVISHNDGSFAEIDVLFENFSRAFKFLVPGYYSIDFDITKSALYKQLTTSHTIVNPDDMDYDNFSKNATVPWTPIDKASLEYGDLLVSNILVRCVDNVDVINSSNYSLTAYSPASQSQSGLAASSTVNAYRNPGLVVNSVGYTTGKTTSCSSDNYLIDTSSLPMFVSGSSDQNISVPSSSSMRNFRNRIFDSVIFNGPGDFIMHEQLQSGARCAITVDMRNTRFYNCEFNNVVFGADRGSQLILDGSIFYSCNFRNCKFNISPKNMLFNKCRINNCHDFMNAYGAYGNAFAGLAANDVLNLFNFIGGKSGNNNNLFTFINVNTSISQSIHNGFISSQPGLDGSGSFSGNIIFRNYVDGSDGDPVYLGKVNAHGNLFSNNFFFSSGKISLADNQKEREKQLNKSPNQYPILRQYVQNTSAYDPLKDTNHWYTKIDIGTCGPNSTLFYDGMSSGFVSAWQGNRYGDVHGQTGYDLLTRAFPFECDPINPSVSSPWHNVIYELTIDKYQWGFRSFQYNFLFGSCDSSAQVSFATLYKWKNNYTDTSPNNSLQYPNSKCKARWKGMKEAIRSVIEGNLVPKDGRQSINEPCNVALYVQSCRGYPVYRSATTAIWNSLSGTTAQKDAAFYAILDDVINDIISIKGRTQSSGKLSVILDAVAYSASPSQISLFRSCSDYKSDALELSDWYIKTKLEQAGIQVFYESKYKKTANQTSIGNGALSATSYPVDWATVPFYADDYWIWYTSPNRPTPPGPGFFANWVGNGDVPIIYRGLNSYWPTNPAERAVDLYHSISTVEVDNAIRDLNINTADNPGPLVNYYTAQYAAATLYSWSDHFRLYENLKSGSSAYKGVLLSTPNYMNVDFSLVSNGYDVLPIYSTNPSTGQPFDPYNSYWRLSVVSAKNSVFFINGTQKYFDSASFVANPTGYQGVYWTQAGLNYWDQNIRQSSLIDFISMLRSFSSQAAPQSAVAEGWNGAVYPNDSWTQSIITSGMYSEWTCVPYVPDENFNFFAASWKAPVNVTRSTDLIVQSYFPWGRISANPAKDAGTPDPSEAVNFYINNNIPVGKRVMFPNFIQSAFIDSYWATQPGGRIQDSYHPDDACRDSSSNIVTADTSDPRGGAYAGIQSFASPWMDNATSRVKSFWNNWLDAFKANGGSIDYMMGDIIDGGWWSPVSYFSSIIRQDGGAGSGYLTHLNYIVNDPRTQSTTVGNASIYGSLYSQLKLDQGQTLSDFNNLNLADGFTGGYKILNFVTSRLGAYYVNEGFYKPIQSKFPNMQVSNWMGIRLTESDQVPDLNGHRSQVDNTMGNAAGAVTYGEMGLAATVYEVSTSDPTTLSYNPSTTKRYGYDSNGNKSGWKCFLLDQQMLRANVRNLNTGHKLHVWIPTTASFNIPGSSNMGGSGTLKQIEYWKELIKHDAMLCPEIFGYWNYYSFSNEDQVFVDVLAEINVQTDGKRMLRLPESKNKFNFNDHYLATGATRPNQTNLWRITTNYDTVNTLVVNSTSYDVRTTPGIWLVTRAMKITLTNYNAATKTLTLSALDRCDSQHSFFSDSGSYLALFSSASKTINVYGVSYSPTVSISFQSTVNLGSLPFSGASNQKCLVSDDGSYLIVSCPNNKSVYFFDTASNRLLQTITEDSPGFGSLIAADKDFYGLVISSCELNRSENIYDTRAVSWSACSVASYYKRNYKSSISTQKFKKIHGNNAYVHAQKSGIDAYGVKKFTTHIETCNLYGDLQKDSSVCVDMGVYRFSDIAVKKYNFALSSVALKNDQLLYNSSFLNIDSPRYIGVSSGMNQQLIMLQYQQEKLWIGDPSFYSPIPTDAQLKSIFTMMTLPSVKQFSIVRKINNLVFYEDKSYSQPTVSLPVVQYSNVPTAQFENPDDINFYNNRIAGSFAEKTFIRGVFNFALKFNPTTGPFSDILTPSIDEQILITKVAINDYYTYHVSQVLTFSNGSYIKNIRVYRTYNTNSAGTDTYTYQDYVRSSPVDSSPSPNPSLDSIGLIKIMFKFTDAVNLENTFLNNNQLSVYQKFKFGILASKPYLANPKSHTTDSQFAYTISDTILSDNLESIFASNNYIFLNFSNTTMVFKIDNNLPYKPMIYFANIKPVYGYKFCYNSSGEYFTRSNTIYKFNNLTAELDSIKNIG